MGRLKVFDSINEFCREYGLPVLHPLISVYDMEQVNKVFIEGEYCFNCYIITLKDCYGSTLRYGRNYYDYQSGSMLFTAPRQVMKDEYESPPLEHKGWILLFHSDLLRGTGLGNNIGNYTFFQYAVNEALCISDEERNIIIGCFRNIQMELHHAMDDNSKPLIISYLELLLNYSKRFYERQFISRSQTNPDFLSRFERILEDYFNTGQLLRQGIPGVKYLADRMNLSANYLSDMLRKYTGKNASEHIQLKLIDIAKDRLLYHSEKTVNEVAYELGFEYPQYFCRLFKKRVGMTPNEYRAAN